MDTYTITLTDGTEYTFKVPNAPVAIEIENNRVDYDDNDVPYALPYYVGASTPLNIDVTAVFADGSELEVDSFTVEDFSTAAEGANTATIKFGALEETLDYAVINISDEIAYYLAQEGLTDVVPGMSQGVSDYSYSPANNSLYIIQEDGIEYEDARLQYRADLLAAGYTSMGVDSYGDENFKSPNGELKLNVWKSYGMVRVDIYNIKPDPTPAGATVTSVLFDIYSELGSQYTTEEAFVEAKVTQPQEGVYYFYMGLNYGSLSDVPGWVETMTNYYMPKYLVADGEAYAVDLNGDQSADGMIQEFLTSDGTIKVQMLINVSSGIVWADFYAFLAA